MQAPHGPKDPAPDLEAVTKKAAMEITLLLDRSHKCAVDITRAVYLLVEILLEQQKDWHAAVVRVQVNPEVLSAWQVCQWFGKQPSRSISASPEAWK